MTLIFLAVGNLCYMPYADLQKILNTTVTCVGNVVPQHYSLTSDCLIKSHSKKVTPITVPKAALVSSEAKNLY